MRETLELLEDLLGEGLFKVGDKFIDVPRTVVAGSADDLKKFLSGGNFNVYGDEEDLVAQRLAKPRMQGQINVGPVFAAAVEKARNIKNAKAKALAISALLDEDNAADIQAYMGSSLVNTGSNNQDSRKQLPFLDEGSPPVSEAWKSDSWVKDLYYAADQGREGAVGNGEFLSCVYFADIVLAGESNTAAVDIASTAKEGRFWSVKSGEKKNGTDDYKVNGKIAEFKKSLLRILNDNEKVDGLEGPNFTWANKCRELTSSQAYFTQDAMLSAVALDSPDKTENELNSRIRDFYRATDAAVMSMGGNYNYMFVSEGDWTVVHAKSSLLRFRGTTQDKVQISLSIDTRGNKDRASMTFSASDWARAKMSESVSDRKVRNSIQAFEKARDAKSDNNPGFVQAWNNLDNMMGNQQVTNVELYNKGFKPLLKSTNALVDAIYRLSTDALNSEDLKKDQLSGAAGEMHPNAGWSLGLIKLQKDLSGLKATTGMDPKEKKEFMNNFKTKLETLYNDVKRNIDADILASTGAIGSSLSNWLGLNVGGSADDTMQTSGRLRPGPLVSETLTLLEDLLTP